MQIDSVVRVRSIVIESTSTVLVPSFQNGLNKNPSCGGAYKVDFQILIWAYKIGTSVTTEFNLK